MLATCLSFAALPVLVGQLRDHSGENPAPVAAVGPGGDLSDQLQSSGVDPVPATGPVATETPTSTAPPTVITIATPAPLPATSAHGEATFRRWPPGTFTVSDPCLCPAAPLGARLTVTNLDNGHVTSCTVVDRPALSPGHVIVLDANHFEELADLGESTVPVRLLWK